MQFFENLKTMMEQRQAAAASAEDGGTNIKTELYVSTADPEIENLKRMEKLVNSYAQENQRLDQKMRVNQASVQNLRLQSEKQRQCNAGAAEVESVKKQAVALMRDNQRLQKEIDANNMVRNNIQTQIDNMRRVRKAREAHQVLLESVTRTKMAMESMNIGEVKGTASDLRRIGDQVEQISSLVFDPYDNGLATENSMLEAELGAEFDKMTVTDHMKNPPLPVDTQEWAIDEPSPHRSSSNSNKVFYTVNYSSDDRVARSINRGPSNGQKQRNVKPNDLLDDYY